VRQATAVQRAECRTRISPLPKERANTMNGLRGMAWLLVFQSIGEVLVGADSNLTRRAD